MPTIHAGSIELAAQRLVQEVGADVAGADDRGFDLHAGPRPQTNATDALPMPAIVTLHPVAGHDRLERHERAREHDLAGRAAGSPKLAERVGEPGHADERASRARRRRRRVLMTSPFFSTTMPQRRRGRRRAAAPRPRRARTARTRRCRRSCPGSGSSSRRCASRRSRSTASRTRSPPSTSSCVTPGPARSRFSTNAISPSARGWISSRADRHLGAVARTASRSVR